MPSQPIVTTPSQPTADPTPISPITASSNTSDTIPSQILVSPPATEAINAEPIELDSTPASPEAVLASGGRQRKSSGERGGEESLEVCLPLLHYESHESCDFMPWLMC